VCLRDGKEVIVHPGDVVVGDLVQIKAGMDIPVDGIVISGTGILSSEAALTGESDDLKKEPLDICMVKKNEKMAELGSKVPDPHDVPSPVLLSGT
jgi:P-type E1-E2 ATPase